MPARRLRTPAASIAQGLNPIDVRKRDGGIPTFGHMADAVREALSAGFRNEKHKAQWKTTLETYAAPLRTKPVDTIATDDVLSVLKPIWTKKAETASRLRGRIEKVLDAAKAKGFRNGENPARWRGHLDHLLPKPLKLTRGHHEAMAYEDIPKFVADLRKREATAALALEFCILTAALFGQVLGMQWSEIDVEQENLDGACGADEGRSRTSRSFVYPCRCNPQGARRKQSKVTLFLLGRRPTNHFLAWQWK